MIALAVEGFESRAVGYVEINEIVVGDVYRLNERDVGDIELCEAVAVDFEIYKPGSAFKVGCGELVARCVEVGQRGITLAVERGEVVARHIYFGEGAEPGEVEGTGKVFVFPFDGGDMAVGHGHTLPGGGSIEVYNVESGGVGTTFLRCLSQKSF